MASLTAILMTLNEEQNVGECIRRLGSLPERICVVDSGSTDGTRDIARGLGAQVVEHPFVDYASQFNWALEHLDIATEWVLRIDADEFYTPELCAELEAAMAEHARDDVNGFITCSDFCFMGRQLRHGGDKRRKIVAFRRGHGFMEPRRMDEHTLLKDGRAVALHSRFEHHDHKDLTRWIAKLNLYASREADDYFADRERYRKGEVDLSGIADEALIATRRRKFTFYYRLPKFLRCWMLFLYDYLLRGGFLDGKEGFVYHFMYARWYRTLVDAKILEREKGGGA